MSDKDSKEEEEKALSRPDLPGTKPLATQVGGHCFGKNGRKFGMLDRGNGTVLKTLQAPPRGTRELWLYQTAFAPACRDQQLLELRHFLPGYHGTQLLDGMTFLVLDNISHRFPKPNVLDLKIGRVTYDPEADEKKQQHEMAKYPPLKQLGFKLTGMMMHDALTGCPQHFGKEYCQKVTAETMLTDGLGKFFGLQDGCLRRDVVGSLLGRLRRIERWFQMQRIFNFYASSLLIVYSSQDHSNSGNDPESKSGPENQVSITSAPTTTTPVASSGARPDPVPPAPLSPSLSPRPYPGDTHGRRNPDTVFSSPSSPPAGVDPCSGADSATTGAPRTSLAESDVAVSDGGCSPAEGPSRRTSSSRPRPGTGQKRGHMEGNEEGGSQEPSASLRKRARQQAAGEESVEGQVGEGKGPETKVETGSLETEGDRPAPTEGKPCGVQFSAPKADTGLSEHEKDALILNTKGDNMPESEGGIVPSGDKTAAGSVAPRACWADPVEVRMIDFAHVFPAVGKDSNYLFGLQKLISLLEELLKM